MALTNMRITEYTTDEQFERLAELASEIWHECYGGLISDGQIDYMVDKFQSAEAMREQTAQEGYRYFVLEIDGEPGGYYGLVKKPGEGLDPPEIMCLSKFYLRRELRGKGFSSQMFREIKRFTRRAGLEMIKLTVNRGNIHAINVYKHIGMRMIKEQVTDIGSGYVMDDYVFGIMI